VEAGNHYDLSRNDPIKNAVGKAVQHCTANIFSNGGKAFGVLSNHLHHHVDGFQEFCP
jgi:hypothetical protein